ncbi:MAG TPA: esterase-like activity of phytase family protein [Pseudonocardia sp.]|nr:esterase-like activity of phytase family protein [Pseudonocardia sp.]
MRLRPAPTGTSTTQTSALRRTVFSGAALATAALLAAIASCAPASPPPAPAAPTTSAAAAPSTEAAPTSAPSAPGATGTAGGKPAVLSDSTLPRMPLAQFSNGLIAGSVPDDHAIVLGGTGSDIYPADDPNQYWAITDRGPNGQVKVDHNKRRTFPVPNFDPAILRVSVAGPALHVEQAIPITTTSGKPVTGLSNSDSRDEPPYDWSAQALLPVNPAGLDTEGMVRAPNGDFWISEEYAPSILHVSSTGKVLTRYVPAGLSLPGTDYPVQATLPAILAKRQINRGFESMALNPDGHTVYASLQSPLALPNDKAGGNSRTVRLFAFDINTGQATAEYAYPLEDVNRFDEGAGGDQSEMKISAMAWYGPEQLLVDERTDDVAKLYVIRLSGATNLLGGPFDDAGHNPPLEQTDLAHASVTPLAKTPLLDLTASIPSLPKKIEGIAVRDQHTIAVANDNDFGMTEGKDAFGANGKVHDSGVPSRVLLLHVP